MANLFRCGGGSSGGTKVYYLGEGTLFNIAELLPDVDYTKLTKENFIVGICDLNGGNASYTRSNTQFHRAAITNADAVDKNYDSNTGILDITNYTQNISYYYKPSSSGGYIKGTSTDITHTCFAYLVLGEIKIV